MVAIARSIIRPEHVPRPLPRGIAGVRRSERRHKALLRRGTRWLY
jgi:hypothetical protein